MMCPKIVGMIILSPPPGVMTSSTSPTCGNPQHNDMVSSDIYCNLDSELIVDDHSSLSCCNVSSMDLNTSSTQNNSHACVDSPCISCRFFFD